MKNYHHFFAEEAKVFFPSRIPSLALWLDAADAGTITQTGGFVSQWDDKSIEQTPATQSIEVRKPSYDAANDELDFNDSYLNVPNYDDAAIVSSNALTVAIKVKLPSAGPTVPRVIMGKGSFETLNFYIDVFSDNLRYKVGDSILITHDISSEFGTYISIVLRAGGGNLLLIINGQEIETSSAYNTISDVADGLLIGARLNSGTPGNFYTDGAMSDIILYDRALSDEEIEQLKDYLYQSPFSNEFSGEFA